MHNEGWEYQLPHETVPANDNEPVPVEWPDVVAFTGTAGAGKSTAADYLVERGYTRVKFAGPLKAMCRAIGLTHEQIEGDAKETPSELLCGKSPRQFMQLIGTDFGRNLIGEDLWINLWRNAANDVLVTGGRVVSDDCRFPNEVAAVASLDGVVIGVAGRGGITGSHASEKQAIRTDWTIANVGSKRELATGVAAAMAALS